MRTLVRLKTMEDEWRLREETSHKLGLSSDDIPGSEELMRGARVLVIEDDAGDAKLIEEGL